MANPFEAYLKKIEADWLGGQATEHTYRPALETLIESLASGIDASNDPKHIECGSPDFIVEHRKVPLGYVETKDVGADLDKIEKSDQLKRYRQSLHNLILTDYLEFRWYVNGERKLAARLATVGKGKKLAHDLEGIAAVERLFNEFYQTEVPTVGTPHDLAERMAQLTKLVRELTANTLQAEAEEDGVLRKQYKTFQEFLLPNLKPVEFADIYAQTMAYGLFAARLNTPDHAPFNRASAYQHLSDNRFLRKLFLDVGEELERTPIAPFLDDLAALLARADMTAILKDFGKRTRTEDPVVHFYETFLASYDPKLRESRGVYYTPEPAVQFIVNSVDWLLRNRFDRPLGLAAKDVYVLDPATGTSTFLYFVVRIIYETLMSKRQGGTWQEYVHQNLLPRLFGFELLVAPYVIAHLKLSLLLKDLGYQWGKDDRLHIYLTNALDEGITRSETLGDLGWYISQEASEAAQVKKNFPIMVVLGNPPYSNFGMLNKNNWILGLLEDYKTGLNERKINLDDDFIKFIRFGQWRIDQTGQGILAFITNNTFIDGLTHRRMRQALMESFSDIYILDLHGSSKKQEQAPDGSKDENIFDIQQGVSISLFVKEAGKTGPARVRHAELWGPRARKYAALAASHVGRMDWKELRPAAENYFFAPKHFKREKEYAAGWSLTDIFPVQQNGLKTDRDDLFFDFDRATLEKRIKTFYTPDDLAPAFREQYRVEDSSSYDLLARRRRTKYDRANVRPCLYRPFDVRWLYYAPGLTSRPAYEVMQHFLAGDNLALIGMRQYDYNIPQYCYFWVANQLTESRVFISVRGIANVFPLYLYPNGDYPTTLFDYANGRRPNLSEEFIADVAARLKLTFIPDGVGDLKKTFGPENVFHYAYAVFHSPTYRERYAEFLKIDFPRLPLTSDRRLFAKLAAKGAELVSLHLLKASTLEKFITSYPIAGNNVVATVKCEKRKVWVNDEQYFGGLPEAVWEFRVGGYQVCDKWLKDRKGRALSNDDLAHYQRIVVALKETIRIMAEIDKAIPSWPLS
jgi:hypothetical protein